MNKKPLAIAALAVAVLGIATLSAGSVSFSADLIAADDGTDEPDENMTGAGGGGWFRYDGAKDTFGFYLNSSDISMSEFVLQARDVGVTVHAIQFDSIVFSYDSTLGTGSAEASGLANVSGVEASFHLMVEDNGGRDVDHMLLELSGNYTGTWDVVGLGGGQIWVFLV